MMMLRQYHAFVYLPHVISGKYVVRKYYFTTTYKLYKMYLFFHSFLIAPNLLLLIKYYIKDLCCKSITPLNV